MKSRGLIAVLLAVISVHGLAGASARAASPDPSLLIARTQASRLVGLVPLPAATTTLAIDPFTSRPFTPPGPPEPWQVLAAGHWLAPVPVSATESYLVAHKPPGATQSGIEFGGGTLSWSEILTFPAMIPAVTSASLEIDLSPYGRSQTEIDATATILWRPSWEQIPLATRRLAVSVDNGPSMTVSGARRIDALARLFSELRNVPSFLPSCAGGFDPRARS